MTCPRSVLLVLVLASVGCDDGEDTGFDHYFAARPYPSAACNVADQRLGTMREVHLFTYGNADVPPYSRSLQRYYRRHGLQFFSHDPVRQIGQPYVLDTDGILLDMALAKEFPGVDLNDQAAVMRDPALYARVVRFTMNFIFRPVIEFARDNGHAGLNVTNLAVVPDIVRPGGGDLLGPGAEVVGLAVSPALIEVFAHQSLDEGAAWQSIDLPADFTPMMFLDGRVLGDLMSGAPDLADLVAAHEFGHTGALVHRTEDHNLMLPAVMPGVSACTDSLEDDQVETMRKTLGVGPQGAPLTLALPGDLDRLQRLLPPADLPALRRGDRRAFARLLRPLIETIRR
jgi:hypothetical protein